jgi:hypothetical protein
MAVSKTKICSGSFLCLIIPGLLGGQERRQQSLDKACREFVGTFYAWYLAKAVMESRGPAWNLALRYRRYIFSSDLFRQLSEDSEAQRKAGRDIVGLDFDPFLNTQDRGERYIVEKTTIRDGTCWADVYGVWDGKESSTPNVRPKLVRKGGPWIFVNFYYPDPSKPKPWDLLSELKELREAREQGADVKDNGP